MRQKIITFVWVVSRRHPLLMSSWHTDAVKLASRSPSGTWTVEAVDAVSAGSPSLAYDNAGTANIACVAGGTLKYARRSE